MEKAFKIIGRSLLLLLLAYVTFKIVQFCVVLSEPPYPPYHHELCTDTVDYMKVNAYVQELLQTDYTDFFPDKIQSPEDASYRYEYSFSDRELYLTLYLEQSFSTDTQFETETSRIRSFPDGNERDCGDIKYVVFDMPNADEIHMYLRDGDGYKAWDFVFSAIKIDKAERQVTYLLAYEYDNCARKDVIVNFLNEYLQDTTGQQ